MELITAKSRVAPVKNSTIPRLELASAQLLVTTLMQVKDALRLPDVAYHLWSDSTIVHVATRAADTLTIQLRRGGSVPLMERYSSIHKLVNVTARLRRWLPNQRQYRGELVDRASFKDQRKMMNENQKHVYNSIMTRIHSGNGGIMFLDVPGGTGKTFLINLIISQQW